MSSHGARNCGLKALYSLIVSTGLLQRSAQGIDITGWNHPARAVKADRATEGADVVYPSAPPCDPGGNCASGSVSLSIDRTAPTVTCAPAPTFVAGEAGATVRASVTDATSGAVDAALSTTVYTGSVDTWSALFAGVDRAGLSSAGAALSPCGTSRRPP